MTVPWPWAAASGVLAAALGLAVTELVTAPGDNTPSVVSSVAARLIDNAPGSLVRFGIDRFGTNDKPALVLGIWVVCVVAGAVCGILAGHRRWLGVTATIFVSAIGLSLALGDELASRSRLWLASILGAVAAVAALLALLRSFEPRGAVNDPVHPGGPEPISDGP